MNRGDRREPIFLDDADHRRFLSTLAEACAQTDWQAHAFCLMRNLFKLEQYLETRRAQEDGDEFKPIRRGWCVGSEAFRRELLESVHTRATESHHAETRRETTEEKGRRILKEELDQLGWTGAELVSRAKGEGRKIRIAERLRAETAVTLKWIAKELHMGTWTHVANRLQKMKGKDDGGNQAQFDLV